ncbi:MAG: HEAT repeat domain-containing protein [Planctomycetes bacterium]|nr:HEAT repeat domain-containing protein [Planctomycetota bacterium]
MFARSGVVVVGVVLAGVFWWTQPFDAYLFDRWGDELSSAPDDEVRERLEQIAAFGDQSFSTLVEALHSERQIVAETAALVMQRKLQQMQLRSTDETSPLVADLASEMARQSESPGPYSARASTQLATRLLLWPVDRELIDSERLVIDCELIVRAAKQSTRGHVAQAAYAEDAWQDRSLARNGGIESVELSTPLPGGGLPVELADTPPLPPQTTYRVPESLAASPSEPQQFVPVQAPRTLDTFPISADGGASANPISNAPTVDRPQSLESRQDTESSSPRKTVDPNLQVMSSLDVMHKLTGDDETLAREAVDELYRRGFKTKHFRLAELLVDPDPNIRLQLVQSLPQLSGIDSRPWLLWLSRDQDPIVRKAAVTVIATSADPALQERVRELGREETDDEVLKVVRQILDGRQSGARR